MLSRVPNDTRPYRHRDALEHGTSVIEKPQNPTEGYGREVIRTDSFAESEVAALFARNPFQANSEQLQSDDVLARIENQWKGIVHAPWSGEIEGPLALLKDHLTRGDTPRFWSTGIKGHYGYRVRFGSHVWLLGKVFVDPFMSEPSACNQLVVYSTSLARSGTMWFSVQEEAASTIRDVVRVTYQD
ncbi:MAG: hypothetical protein DYG92_11850 [Leptolyngbya sp. PLA1]|nr:hypothetical protein [Leptolyngbya sp. PLA1]